MLALLAFLAPAGAAAATGSISGTVTDAESHAPIEKVLVCAFEESSEKGECAKTNAAGQYVIPTLPAGEYLVEFLPEAEGLDYLFQFYDDKADFEEADMVAVVSGVATTDIDAALHKAGEISGKVTASVGGAAVEEVKVCAVEVPEEEFGGCEWTDEEGKYTIGGLETGEYKVVFWPGFSELNLQTQYYDHRSSWAEADPVEVTAGATRSGVDAALEPGAEIQGTVYSAASGASLRGILVCSVWAASGELTECTETRAGGHYSLVGLESGVYKVAFSLEFREFFPEEPAENDGFPTQFYNGKATLAAADPLSLTAPNVLTGIDAHLGPPPIQPTPIVPPIPPVTHKTKAVKCRRHFRKKTVNGKVRCVRVHGSGSRHHRGSADRRVPARLLANLR